MENKSFIYCSNKAKLSIENFNETKEEAIKILNDHPVFEIKNENDKKIAKAIRGKFKEIVSDIKQKNKDDILAFSEHYDKQCAELILLFEKQDKEFEKQLSLFDSKIAK